MDGSKEQVELLMMYEEIKKERNDYKQQRDSLIKDVAKLREKIEELKKYNSDLKQQVDKWFEEWHDMKVDNELLEVKLHDTKEDYRIVNSKYTNLTNHIKDKAIHNPSVSRYIDLVHVIDELEKEWVIMAYEYEIKSGQKVFIENTNGHLYKATVININEYREPSMRVSLQVDGIEDIVFTGLENIKIMEDK